MATQLKRLADESANRPVNPLSAAFMVGRLSTRVGSYLQWKSLVCRGTVVQRYGGGTSQKHEVIVSEETSMPCHFGQARQLLTQHFELV